MRSSSEKATHLQEVVPFVQRQRAEQQQRLHATPPRPAALVVQREVVEQRDVEELQKGEAGVSDGG